MIYFPFIEYRWFYIVFIGIVLTFLAFDLGLFHKKSREIRFKEASLWTGFWIVSARVFNFLFYLYAKQKFVSADFQPSIIHSAGAELAQQKALEFLTSFLVEKSLALDNIFVFAVVFGYLGIPKQNQHRILVWGILGALILRSLLIIVGSSMMQYRSVVLFFGILLVLTSLKIVLRGSKPLRLDQSPFFDRVKKLLRIHPSLEGDKYFIQREGRTYLTPLFLALVTIELIDILFAFDSIPAIFSITREPLIVFASNIFALLGMRSMYFLMVGFSDRFIYFKQGLAGILFFIGCKMVWLDELYEGNFPMGLSLFAIACCLGGSILASVFFSLKNKKDSSLSDPTKLVPLKRVRL